MHSSRFLQVSLALICVVSPIGRAAAQTTPLSVQDVVILLELWGPPADVMAEVRVEIIRESCISFSPDLATIAQLRNAGADDRLLKVISGVCRKNVDSPGTATPSPATESSTSAEHEAGIRLVSAFLDLYNARKYASAAGYLTPNAMLYYTSGKSISIASLLDWLSAQVALYQDRPTAMRAETRGAELVVTVSYESLKDQTRTHCGEDEYVLQRVTNAWQITKIVQKNIQGVGC